MPSPSDPRAVDHVSDLVSSIRSTTPAGRRYVRRFLPTMACYMAALFFANWAIDAWRPAGAMLFLLSALPALPIVGILAVIGLYLVEERDEYLRGRVVTAMIAGLGLMLSVATVWGFLEQGGVVPHVPAYWAFILWCAGWGTAQCAMGIRDRLADRAA